MATELFDTVGSDSWEVLPGVFELTALRAGGGGGGGGAGTGVAGAGGGGGGVGYRVSVAVVPGQSVSYTVGAGGAAGAGSGGGNGGNSTIDINSTTATGNGGLGGVNDDVDGNGYGPGGWYTGDAGSQTGGNGGVANGSDVGGGGGCGGGTDQGGGGDAGASGGAGGAGSSPGGNGGASGSPGVDGSAYGGGGGGGDAGFDGGAGASGFVQWTYLVRTAPYDVYLDTPTIAENEPIDTQVGNFIASDDDAGDTATFTLADGILDNDSFYIDGISLFTAEVFDYEARNSYTIRVTATDSYGLEADEDIVVTVTNVNEAPTAIQLSSTSVRTGSASGTTVGALTTTDADAGDSHTYSLAAAVDNASFTLTGANLKTAFLADYSSRSLFTVQVTTHDAGGLTFDQNFTISITTTDNTDEEQQVMSLTISTPLSEGVDSSLSASQALTVPTGARRLTVQALGQNVRCKLSGAVTSSTGFQIAVGQVREFVVHPSYPNAAAVIAFEAIRFIEETSGATLIYSFFAV